MAHCLGKGLDRQLLARLNAGIMLVLVGGGLGMCAFAAVAYDIGRLFSAW